jgi:GTP cyclohydrolase I
MSHDRVLGTAVRDHLLSLGVETPMSVWSENSYLDNGSKKVQIAEHVRGIMQVLGLDLRDDSLEDTPNRVAKMYIDEVYRGLDYANFPKCTVIDNKMASELVCVKEIEVSSTCEHHLVTIDGKATIAYIPSGKVIGLSKINRIVSFFARRPQVQERLTNQVWHALNFILKTDNIAVYIDAVHFCVKARGVRDANSSTITNKLGGEFMKDPSLRAEFMSIARNT